MADVDRAVPMHEVGTTPDDPRSVPVKLKKSVVVPVPPQSGTKVLRSVNGTLSWVDPS